MRVPLDWLYEYCAPDLDVDGVEERLTMTGTKVEAIHHHGVSAVKRFVVGRILTCDPHPNADRLSVCTVELGDAGGGEGGVATIVCGAPNVAAGQTVAVALPGAVMGDGTEIKQAKLRGVLSEGMICAENELGIGPGGQGILVLDEMVLDADRSTDRRRSDAGRLEIPFDTQSVDRPAGISDLPAPGTPLADVLPIATEVIELEVTPNRPDCLGVYGVARELHAATGATLAPEPWRTDPGSTGPLETPGVDTIPAQVTVECPDLCPRFTARVFEDVTIAPSPLWLAARLSAAGQRPINNVVDITNYAMLLTGQPLHAFDLDRVAGARLTVRRAREGEQVTTLDGQTRVLDSEMVVIDDADGPTSIAGLMGGERSEVQQDTTRVLLEVANWHGPNIHRTSWALGLRSEASSRFEKGLAPEQCLWAQAVATRLMIELCGAKLLLPGTIDVGSEEWTAGNPSPAIRLREARVSAILGIEVPRARQAEILNALDFDTVDASDGLDVTPPPVRRQDVTREADLIEEVARIDGLERLPITLPARRGAYGLLSHEQRLRRRAVDALVGRGLYETVGWTFASPGLADRLCLDAEDSRREAPVVENPLSEEQSLLRTTLLGSLLDTAARNLARGMSDLRLFETGTVFALPGTSTRPQPAAPEGSSGAVDAPQETGIAEHRSLAVLLTGGLCEPSWGTPEPPVADFYAVKAVLEALSCALRVDGIELVPDPQPFLHPGRAAAVTVPTRAGEPIGWLGELHPLVAQSWELPGASVFEIDLDRLICLAPIETGYEDLIGYPPLRQDLAVVLPMDVPAASVLSVARTAAGELLCDARVFDVYTGPQVGEGNRSLALALSFRAADRTLADEDIAPVRERIVAALGALGGELRGG
jgi:phenylalanyl-tRNA synthetase beta chain